MDYYLYKGKIYHCSEVTTEGELYGADCSWGSGKCLLFLDELEGGQYVDANDCLQVSPNFFQHVNRAIRVKSADIKGKVKDLLRPKCFGVDLEDF